MNQSQDIEAATTAVQPTSIAAPDNKTRRYDRQLRLWAATGQAALESSRILVLSGTATSTSILKNLVLPGVGHFTILDHKDVTAEDAGNNFFLEADESIGKPRAEEAVRLLRELNDGVEGCANTADLSTVLAESPSYFAAFDLIIAHNVPSIELNRLASFLWTHSSSPSLVVIRSAGFLAEFFLQFREQAIIESHPDIAPSLRIDKPFPALLDHALQFDLNNMDITEHGHIPYVIILVRALVEWKSTHNGRPPITSAEKMEFKKVLLSMKRKPDEENIDEAVSQAYRVWTETVVPTDIEALFQDSALCNGTAIPDMPVFYQLLSALRDYTRKPPYTLPLTSTLPDMKADTTNYIQLQQLYKRQAEDEKKALNSFLLARDIHVEQSLLDTFVKNSHGLKILRGRAWTSLDSDNAALADSVSTMSRDASIHLALSALFTYFEEHPDSRPTTRTLISMVHQKLSEINVSPPAELEDIIGEIVRSPTSDLPNVAAFLGGLVAQEAIKLITKQYVPINGLCTVDMINSTTGITFT